MHVYIGIVKWKSAAINRIIVGQLMVYISVIDGIAEKKQRSRIGIGK
jgi:hypothetical protein